MTHRHAPDPQDGSEPKSNVARRRLCQRPIRKAPFPWWVLLPSVCALAIGIHLWGPILSSRVGIAQPTPVVKADATSEGAAPTPDAEPASPVPAVRVQATGLSPQTAAPPVASDAASAVRQADHAQTTNPEPAEANGQTSSAEPNQPARAMARAPHPVTTKIAPPKSLGGYRLAGPYSHKNLSVFLVCATPSMGDCLYTTLDEALADKRVIVHETGQVNELSIENVSETEVFIQAGDIVKGGRQDRVLAYDLILPPHSGQVPVASYCVEHGRWSQRGNEVAGRFSESNAMLPSKEGKMGFRGGAKSQQAVWNSVSETQQKLGARLEKSVAAPESASSLQLSLEDKDLKAVADEYVAALKDCADRTPDAVGMLFAVNGEVNSGDLYGSRPMFRKLWPRLLKAAAVEATANYKRDTPAVQPPDGAIAQLLDPPPSAQTSAIEVTEGQQEIRQEYGGNIFLESRDSTRPERWLRRSYLAKPSSAGRR
jgi:hypothetical protein